MASTDKRCTISVSRRTYTLLRERCASPHKFVDGIVASALDDPKIAARILERLRQRDVCGTLAPADPQLGLQPEG